MQRQHRTTHHSRQLKTQPVTTWVPFSVADNSPVDFPVISSLSNLPLAAPIAGEAHAWDPMAAVAEAGVPDIFEQIRFPVRQQGLEVRG